MGLCPFVLHGSAKLLCFGNLEGCIPLLIQALFRRRNKIYSLHIAEPYTLGVAAAKVTLENLLLPGIEVHGAEWADCNAGTAANANIVINVDPSFCLVPIDCLYRAHIQAWGIYALPACHRNVKTFPFPFLYFNTGFCWVGYAIMEDRAYQLASSASRAFFMIYHYSFCFHSYPPYIPIALDAGRFFVEIFKSIFLHRLGRGYTVIIQSLILVEQ